MRILMTSTYGTGHLQPLIPYAQALLKRGHQVCVSAPPNHQAALAKAGLDHAPVDFPTADQSRPVLSQLFKLSGDAAFAMAIRARFVEMFAAMALPKLQETIRSWKPDLILRESCEFAAVLAAEGAAIPHARVAILNPDAENFFTEVASGPLDILRTSVGLSPDNGAALRTGPAFTAFPPSFFDAKARSSGHLPFGVRAPVEAAVPPATPPSWMPNDDRPLVYMTFGTVLGMYPMAKAVYRASLDALADLPIHALLTTGPGVDIGSFGAIPANVTVEAYVPQSQIWPYAKAVLCHGGSGTMLGGLAAGIPMVIAPLFADQPHNARSVEAIGAGIAVQSQDAPALRAAIEHVLATPDMHVVAGDIAAEMAAMPGMDDALDVLLAPP